jgi:excinuclease UvrABC nuclease subunit
MKDAGDRVLYVGKAKDLKQRLNHYRTANPDRMPLRHLRMVNEVSRIEFQFCPTEAAALKHEKKLIRSLKPKFNRAGVWPGKAKFIAWRVEGDALEISVTETPAGLHAARATSGKPRICSNADAAGTYASERPRLVFGAGI